MTDSLGLAVAANNNTTSCQAHDEKALLVLFRELQGAFLEAFR
jgi:hypothetical protein